MKSWDYLNNVVYCQIQVYNTMSYGGPYSFMVVHTIYGGA